jgi:hypothetical protein
MSAALQEKPVRPEGAADDELSEEAREAIEQHAEKTPKADQGSTVGPYTQLTLEAGGESPTISELKLAGRSIELDARQFKKGDVVRLSIEIKVGEVAFVDKHDKETGQVVSTTRRHKATVSGYEFE